MTKTFIQTTEFEKNWKRLGLADDELRKLEWEIMKNPQTGTVIQGTGKLRKMRFPYKHQGKSGSVRVCYIDFVMQESIYLITVYAKNEKENFTKSECNNMKSMIELLEKIFIIGGHNMSNVYSSILSGLTEAVEDAKGNGKKLNRRVVTILPIKRYDANHVKKIRTANGMSQKVFAGYMGVSDKTVEAWESGKNHPSGAASRLLNMMEMNENLVEEYPFVKLV